jgi:hypothetical protein
MVLLVLAGTLTASALLCAEPPPQPGEKDLPPPRPSQLPLPRQVPPKGKEAEKVPASELPAAPALPPLFPALPSPFDAHCQPIKVLWVERDEPFPALTVREVQTEKKAKTLTLAYKEEKRICTEYVIKPREVETVVSETVMVPDPSCSAGGHCNPVLKPMTQTRLVKKTIFEAVPRTTTIVVRIPYLKEVEEVVTDKAILLEYLTEVRKCGYGLVVPDVPNPCLQVWIGPQAPCPNCFPAPVEKKAKTQKIPEKPGEKRPGETPAEPGSEQQLPAPRPVPTDKANGPKNQ